MAFDAFDSTAMARALELARRGEGLVEPNPMVGAVVVSAGHGDHAGRIVAEGWHARFGGPHAEVVALAAAGREARGGTLYVTLEPCCHHGKTPPCTNAIVDAGVRRVVVATRDPFPAVNGGGLEALAAAGIVVDTGLHEPEALRLTAPFRKLVKAGKPWVIAKWAMSLDGRMATGSQDDRWISSAESRSLVHDLRGRVDAIAVGIGTALADDPLLTARPPGARQPLRIVLDGNARLPLTSRLVQSARETPLLVAVGPNATAERCRAIERAGGEVWCGADGDRGARLDSLLETLGSRRLTNVLFEGGAMLLGSLFERGAIDEVWAFIAPKIIAGDEPLLCNVPPIDIENIAHPGGDIFVRGLVRSP